MGTLEMHSVRLQPFLGIMTLRPNPSGDGRRGKERKTTPQHKRGPCVVPCNGAD